MTLSDSPVNLSQLHEQDIVRWAETMADLLRQGKFDQLDLEHLIDEVEDLGRRERDRLLSSVRLILQHLLKWHYQPETRSRSWRKTIQRERVNLEAYLEDTPSLKQFLNQTWLEKVYRSARKDAAIETEMTIETFPATCPYTWDQVLDETFPSDLTQI